MHEYVTESFTNDERAILLRYFTNVDKPVFALKNLPEIVKGALFARYSRTAKSLRRLFLDEFYRGEEFAETAEIGSQKASDLYDRIFIEFGDDSVAQLGGAHLAVEQGSNILTKALEWGRLAGYLEQSTRYVPYDDKPGGRYRYFREAAKNRTKETLVLPSKPGRESRHATMCVGEALVPSGSLRHWL